jgi:hypothetical protein
VKLSLGERGSFDLLIVVRIVDHHQLNFL